MADNIEVKKFLFDSNRFDAPDEDENDEPELPSFSEDELEQAKKIAFEQGKSQGLKEAEASREKHVSILTETIMTDVKNLFSSEQDRDKLYEEEAVRLSAQIFHTLFPTIEEKHGIDEIKRVVKDVLTSQSEQPSIIIEVNTEYKSDIENTVAQLKKQLHGSGEIEVAGNEELGVSDCKISWKDGGARRDTQSLCTQILNSLQDGLAENPIMDNNDKSNEILAEEQLPSEEDIKPEEDIITEDDNGDI